MLEDGNCALVRCGSRVAAIVVLLPVGASRDDRAAFRPETAR